MSKQETEEQNIEKNPYKKRNSEKNQITKEVHYLQILQFSNFSINLSYRSPEDQTITKREKIVIAQYITTWTTFLK